MANTIQQEITSKHVYKSNISVTTELGVSCIVHSLQYGIEVPISS